MSSPFDAPREKLGSLTQAARSKHLKQVRGILFFIGILYLAFNAYLFATVEERIDAEIKKQRIVQVDLQKKQEVIQLHKLVAGALMGAGVLFILLAVIVHNSPCLLP